MKKISKFKVETSILILMLLMAIISIITISSAESMLPAYMSGVAMRQVMWYIIGFIVAFGIMFIGNDFIYRHSIFLYVITVISLLVLLFVGPTINNAVRWYVIPGIGNIQPSEFMKIILIIILAKMIKDYNENKDGSIEEEFKFLLKVILVVFIPSILTFIQPDTGMVFIYLVITATMLFVGGIRYRWFALAIALFLLSIGFVLLIYFISNDLFINIFGTDFFLRVDRLLDWRTSTGFQVENSLSAIGTGGLFGNGFGSHRVYFPEPHTDFIFAVYAGNFGLIGALLLLSIIALFDIRLINIANKTNNHINKYVISGIIGMLVYQQIQNIGMTMGLLPITGITLPFISYGGSSLISYMIVAGIFFNISNESMRFTN